MGKLVHKTSPDDPLDDESYARTLWQHGLTSDEIAKAKASSMRFLYLDLYPTEEGIIVLRDLISQGGEKVVLVIGGEYDAGKTTIAKRFCEGELGIPKPDIELVCEDKVSWKTLGEKELLAELTDTFDRFFTGDKKLLIYEGAESMRRYDNKGNSKTRILRIRCSCYKKLQD